jgi:hypothetical protein
MRLVSWITRLADLDGAALVRLVLAAASLGSMIESQTGNICRAPRSDRRGEGRLRRARSCPCGACGCAGADVVNEGGGVVGCNSPPVWNPSLGRKLWRRRHELGIPGAGGTGVRAALIGEELGSLDVCGVRINSRR